MAIERYHHDRIKDNIITDWYSKKTRTKTKYSLLLRASVTEMWRFRPQTAWIRILRHVSATMGQGPASIGSVYFAQLDPHGPIPDLSICFDILYNYNYTFAALINLVITFMLQRKMLLYTDVLMTRNTVCVIKKLAIIRRGCLDIQINKTFQLFTISFNHHHI